MQEVSYEETAVASNYDKQRKTYKLFMVLSRVFYVLCGISIYFALMFGWGFAFFAVWFLASGLFSNYIQRKYYNAYDYIFVTGSVRIIKVRNTKVRKRVLLFDATDVAQIGQYESDNYVKASKMPGVKVVFAPENKYIDEKPKYYLSVTTDGNKYLLVLECSKKFLSYITMFSRRTVVDKELE